MKAPRASSLSRYTPWLLAGLGLVVLGLTLFSSRILTPGISLDLDVKGRWVVLPVRNGTGHSEHDWVRYGLMEMMGETLRRTSGVSVVEPDRLINMARSRELDGEDVEMRKRIEQLGRAMGADIVLDVTALQDGSSGRGSSGRGSSSRGSSNAGSNDIFSLRFEAIGPSGETLAEGELHGSDLVRVAERLTYLIASALPGRAEPFTLGSVYSSSPFLNRLYGMGSTALYTEGPEVAARHFEIALAVRPGFLAAEYRLAECDRRRGRFDHSRRRVLQMLETAQDRGEKVWEVRALHALARVEALAGNTEKAVEIATQVQGHYATREDLTVALEALRDMARFSLVTGDDDPSRQLYEEIQRRQEELGDRLGRVDTLAQLGALALKSNDLESAVGTLNEARALASELGDVRTEMQLLASLGEVASRRGQRQDAARLWERSVTFYEQRGEVGRQLLLQRNIAEALLLDEDLEGAEKAFHEVRELAIGQRDEHLEGLASLRLTWILLRRGYPYQARAHLDRAIELDESLDQPLMIQRMIAWMAYEEGSYQLAFDTLAAVRRQAREGWSELDEDFLEVFAQAIEQRKRLPVPGEQAALGPGTLAPGL